MQRVTGFFVGTTFFIRAKRNAVGDVAMPVDFPEKTMHHLPAFKPPLPGAALQAIAITITVQGFR